MKVCASLGEAMTERSPRAVIRLMRGKTQYGAKRFSVRAGRPGVTVEVHLAKSARKALRRSRTLKATLSATGTDTSGAAIAARQAVKLTR